MYETARTSRASANFFSRSRNMKSSDVFARSKVSVDWLRQQSQKEANGQFKDARESSIITKKYSSALRNVMREGDDRKSIQPSVGEENAEKRKVRVKSLRKCSSKSQIQSLSASEVLQSSFASPTSAVVKV